MNENIALFLQKVEKDEALVAKLSEMKDPDEAYALAASIQEGFTKEEFAAAMVELYKGELTADDLAKYAGGVDTDVVVTTASITGAAAVGSAFAI